MDFEVKKEDTTVKLTDTMETELVGSISKKYATWNTARQSQLDNALLIRDAIYQKTKIKDSKQWKSAVQLPTIFEFSKTIKSNIWKNIYQTPSAMFDISAANTESMEFANHQKSMLVDAFEQIELGKELDKCVNNIVEIGEGILFTGWESKTKQIRRKNPEKNIYNDPNHKSFIIEDKIIYDGIKIKSISPEYFVFDVNKKDNWDSCPKIFKSWATIDDIKSNKVYNLSSKDKEDLKNTGTKDDTSSNTNLDKKEIDTDNVKKGDQLELLEFWGDIKLKDGTILHNYLITVAARSIVIRFETNPYLINPFILATLDEDPDTKRGFCLLNTVMPTNTLLSEIINRKMDTMALELNPDYLAPKGMFTGIIERKPNAVHEYDAQFDGKTPVPVPANSAPGWDFIETFKNSMSLSIGVSANQSGGLESQRRTATELNYTAQGQDSRTSLIMDIINQNLIIPMVKNSADLIANFEFDNKTLLIDEKGKQVPIEINDQVRQGEYKYIYADRSAAAERKGKIDQLIALISQAVQSPDVAQGLDMLKLTKYAMEQLGYENIDQFDKEPPASQEAPPPPPPPAPTPNAITAELATDLIISKKLPIDLTVQILTELGLMNEQSAIKMQGGTNEAMVSGGNVPSTQGVNQQ
jgi:hypothetical protein